MTPGAGSPRDGSIRAVLRRLGAAVSLGVVATIGALAIYRPWGWRSGLPLSGAFDTQLNAIFVHNVLGGSLYTTERLGAPFGQHLQDFPVGADRWSFLLVRALGVVSDDPYTVLALFFVAGFGLIAACTYLVGRELRLGVTTSAVVALLAAFLPYHFWRGQMHVWLSNYVGQPLLVLLAVWVVRDELRLPVVHRHRGDWTRADRRRLGIAIVAIVVLGGTGGYYAVFAVVTLAAAGVLAQARRRSWRSVVSGVVLAAGVGVVLLVNLVPELWWRLRHGVDHEVANRLLIENDQYALRLVKLLLPGAEHRFGPFSWLGEQTVLGEGGEYVGLVAAAGLVAGWVLLFTRGLRSRAGAPEDAPAMVAAHRQPAGAGDDGGPAAVGGGADGGGPTDGTVPSDAGDRSGFGLPLALAAVSAFLFLLGTAGGLGYGVAILGTTQFRGWARVSLPLALCGLFAAGWWVDHWFPRLDRQRTRAVAGAAFVLAVALADQIPTGVGPASAATRASFDETRAFVTALERALDDGAMVFQFPVAGFPEHGPIGDLPDYDLALPALLGDDRLRWSYGGVRGREADWQIWWNQQPLDVRIAGIAAVGFDAVTVDRRAFVADDGAGMIDGLRAVAGEPIATSTDGDLIAFDLRPVRARLEQASSAAEVQRAGHLIVYGVTVTFGGDVSSNLDPLGSQRRFVGTHAEATYTNPLDEPRTLEVRTAWASPTGAHLRVTTPDGDRSVPLGPSPTDVAFPLTVPAGGAVTVRFGLEGRSQRTGGVEFGVLAELHGLVFDEAEVRAVVEQPRR